MKYIFSSVETELVDVGLLLKWHLKSMLKKYLCFGLKMNENAEFGIGLHKERSIQGIQV